MTISPILIQQAALLLNGQDIEQTDAEMLSRKLGPIEELLPYLVIKDPEREAHPGLWNSLRKVARSLPRPQTSRVPSALVAETHTRLLECVARDQQAIINQHISYDSLRDDLDISTRLLIYISESELPDRTACKIPSHYCI